MGNAPGLGVKARACLLLGAVCRRIFHFSEPENLADPAFAPDYFDDEVRRGRGFFGIFAEQPDLNGKIVLDLGCGYGGLMLAVAEMGAERVLGVDVSEERVAFARRRLQPAARAFPVLADAASLPFPDQSVDIIVSDSAIEHLHDLRAALREMVRVLRPGGRVYALWGNSWLTYNGPHLIKCIGVPWVQLLFSDRTIMQILHHMREHGPHPRSYIEYKIVDFQTMGRNTRRKLRRGASEYGLRLVQDDSRSSKPWKQRLSRLPLLDELLAGDIVQILERA
jgi:ubiquinone/menaquinone biosynthesis C-methylase UbiE